MRVSRKIALAALLALSALLPFAAVATAVTTGFRTFVVMLSPQAPNTEGSGVAVIRVDATTGQVCYTITVEGIGVPTEPVGGIGSAHIHVVATGAIFVDLETGTGTGTSGDWMETGLDRYTAIGCVTESSATVEAILADPSAYYVNVHTVAFPGGALTGTLG